jgi:polyisoprenoid-binding protein YceI
MRLSTIEMVRLKTAPIPRAGTYRLRPETCLAEFTVKHMVLSTARGRLAALSGELHLDPVEPLASWVRVDLDAGSIATGNSERDEALAGPGLLGAGEFPVIRFESTAVDEVGPSRFTVWGDLYIRDVVGEVRLDTRLVSLGDDMAYFAGRTTFSRAAFGLRWSSAMERVGVIVGDQVGITVAAQFVSGGFVPGGTA